METFLDIAKYILPSLVVLATAYLLLRTLLKEERKKVEATALANLRKDTLLLRLQAYERLSVFLERSHPNNLITRVNEPDLTVRDLQYLLIESVKTEFEHNLSQQIYVSQEIWATVTYVKDDMIKTVNLLAASLPQNANSLDLAKQILEHYMQSDKVVPSQKALNVINMEVKRLF